MKVPATGPIGRGGQPVDDVPLREVVVPISDIQITFRPDYKIRRATLQPEGKVLEVRRLPNGSSVTVPRLGVHTMVVAELE